MRIGVVLTLLMLTLGVTVNAWDKMLELFKWNILDFQFPNQTLRSYLIRTRKYIPPNNSILGLAVWDTKLFITVPRWLTGTASTLNYINLDNLTTSSPLLIPYPDYDTNDIYNGDLNQKVISTSRIFVDSCNRLWVPDNGQDNIFGSSTALAPMKLLVFDLNTDKLLRNIIIGDDVKQSSSSFYEVTVDVNKECDKAYAYMADSTGYGLLVYSWETDSLRRVSNGFFYFQPEYSVFGSAQFNDGVMALSLSPLNDDGYRTLYFHAFSSGDEYKVSTQVLQDPNLSSDFNNFKFVGSRGPKGQSTNQKLDEKTGVVFYTQILKHGIGCWNSKLYPDEYTVATNGMVAVDRDRYSFLSAMTIDKHRNLWAISNNLLSFASSTMNYDECNYRILIGSIDLLIKDTVCHDSA